MPQLARPAATKTPTRTNRREPASPWSASSSAYFARYGGASAVAVAVRSEMTEKPLRTRYGRVSRHSVPRRRRVARRDQSSTSAPRSRIRCPPGWWTLTPRPFRPCPVPGTGRVRSGHASCCRLLDLATRLHRLGELPLEQAVVVDLAVDGARREQLLVRSARRDPAAVEDDELVRERDRREPVRDDQRRPAAHYLAQPLPDPRLGGRVHRRRRIVQDEDARVDGDCARDRDP